MTSDMMKLSRWRINFFSRNVFQCFATKEKLFKMEDIALFFSVFLFLFCFCLPSIHFLGCWSYTGSLETWNISQRTQGFRKFRDDNQLLTHVIGLGGNQRTKRKPQTLILEARGRQNKHKSYFLSYNLQYKKEIMNLKNFFIIKF